jgi:hypothetical protein
VLLCSADVVVKVQLLLARQLHPEAQLSLSPKALAAANGRQYLSSALQTLSAYLTDKLTLRNIEITEKTSCVIGHIFYRFAIRRLRRGDPTKRSPPPTDESDAGATAARRLARQSRRR